MSPRSSSRNYIPPPVLTGNTMKGVADYIKSNKCRKIAVMLGAGVSTSAGIPDFRSPETGLYANLERLNLPYAEAVFDINYFRKNPVPFYTLANELYPGKFRPTPTHSFLKLLAKKDLLYRCFTQNIDTLELRAGVPPDKIIHAHGSFATQRCIEPRCKALYDGAKMKEHIEKQEIAHCESCEGLVKPDIVFFGESLPDEFIKSIETVDEADLLIVMGTSLTVHPFASVAGMVKSSCPRVLVNLERVGNFGQRPNDVVLLGKCDDVVKELARALGWEKELDRLWAETQMYTEEEEDTVHETKAETETDLESEAVDTHDAPDSKDGDLKEAKDMVEELAEKLAKDLQVNEEVDKGVAPVEDKVSPGSEVNSKVVQGEKIPEKLSQSSSPADIDAC